MTQRAAPLRLALPLLTLLAGSAWAQAGMPTSPAPDAAPASPGAATGTPPAEGPPAMVAPRGPVPPTNADRDIVVNPPATPAPSSTPLVTPPNLDDPNRPQSR